MTVLHISIHDISGQPVTTGGIGQHYMLISKKNISVCRSCSDANHEEIAPRHYFSRTENRVITYSH